MEGFCQSGSKERRFDTATQVTDPNISNDDAEDESRDLTAEEMMASEARSFMFRLSFLLVVGVAIALLTKPPIMIFGIAAVAMKAGSDLARLRTRLRSLASGED